MGRNSIRSTSFSHGAIQCSPAENRLLNSKAPKLFQPKQNKTPSTSGYTVLITGYSDKIYAHEVAHGSVIELDRAINNLRSTPRPSNGQQLKGSIDTRSISGMYYRLGYRIASGQVLVFNIQAIRNSGDSLLNSWLWSWLTLTEHFTGQCL
jgi:hypothetical protein